MKSQKTPASSRSGITRATPDSVWKRLDAFLTGPVDATRLRRFECAFTLTFLIWMGRCFFTWEEWLTEAGFHLNREELQSMGYPEPWPLLVPWQVLGFGVAIALSALLLLWPVSNGDGCAGQGSPPQALAKLTRSIPAARPWMRRWGLVGLCACAWYAQRVDYMSAFTLNKLYVGVYTLLALAPGLWREAGTGRLMQSAAPLRVLQATLFLQYCAAGLAKAGGDWFKGGDVLWSQVQGVYRTELAAWSLRHLPLWVWTAQQHVSLAFELLAPVLFTVRRLLPVAFVLGIGFHLVIALMMKDLIFFSLQMWTFYLLFWPAAGPTPPRELKA